jgi:hypothetical protein
MVLLLLIHLGMILPSDHTHVHPEHIVYQELALMKSNKVIIDMHNRVPKVSFVNQRQAILEVLVYVHWDLNVH